MREHGTRAYYVAEKCRCAPCREANRLSQAERERQKLYGRYNALVDASPVRGHLNMLYLTGVGTRRIAALAGISRTTVAGILNGSTRRVRREVAAAVLELKGDPSELAGHAVVFGPGPARRLQALTFIGWTGTALAAAVGVTPANLTRLFTTLTMTAARAERIARLYDAVWDKPRFGRAAAAAHARAVRRGWRPPAAWDDIDHDEHPFDGSEVAGLLDDREDAL